MSTIRIVLADDHAIFRKGFKQLLNKQTEMELIGEAENGKRLLQITEQLLPDVVLTDIQMPVMNGIDACRRIREEHKDIFVIALTTFDNDHFLIDMLAAGASGYLLKNTNKAELQRAVQGVASGKSYYSDATAKRMERLVADSKILPGRMKPAVQFNERELLIIGWICQELTNKEMASRLHLSVRTVEGYRERIQEKMQAKNTAGIVLYALKHNLVAM